MAVVVRVCAFKPQGFEDTWVAFTEDRGAACLAALRKYDPQMLRFLNSVSGNLLDDEDARLMIESKRAGLIEVE